MFYAASEIVFWILLAAVIGGGIGYSLSQAKLVRLNKRLSQSRADAPMERELAIAWDTIEDLNKRLQVAHETIRDINGETDPADSSTADGEAEAGSVDEVDDSPVDEDELDEIVAKRLAKANKKASVDDGVVGTRLSERVASASSANNLDFSDGLDG